MVTRKPAPAKRAMTKKAPAKGLAKGDALVCGVCGLAVTVDETCGYAEVCTVICCGKPMKAKRARARTAKKVETKTVRK